MAKETRAIERPPLANDGYEIVASIRTDKGCVREINEDSGRLIRPSDPDLVNEKGVLLIVADGMGGHASGEVASQMTVELVGKNYYQSEGDAQSTLKQAVEEANRVIHAASLEDENLRGMGTTCTVLVLLHGQAFAAHVGDTRIYMLREGKIYLLTEDHSAVMEMVKLGIITLDEARRHEDKNVILRALGTAPEVEVSTWNEPLTFNVGDQFLLCSDGLYDLVEDAEIAEVLTSAADGHAASERLIALAKERGGHDNITVGIVGIAPQGAGLADAEDMRITREVEAVK